MIRFSPYDILNRKRKGERLSSSEIRRFIDDYIAGEIPDYQMAALLMAIAIQGMDLEEMMTLTRTMLESGDQWALRDRYDFVADKHSTGGVGDKVSLILTPWVAACGVPVAMISGRGLGHTGGTLDKLESIPGFAAHLELEAVERCLAEAGCVITTSTARTAPADRRIYALRDVTGTVESVPLITASIMSKKLALGASALILDIKTGNGATVDDLDRARALARSMIAVAADSGTLVEAMLTDMSQPLGRAAGNASEVRETLDVLRGRGPADTTELVRAQGIRLLVMSGRYDQHSAAAKLDEVIASGEAIEQTKRWIQTQGGDPDIVDHPESLAAPSEIVEVPAPRSGVVAAMDTKGIGMLTVALGAGRQRHDDTIDHAAGIFFDRKVGEEVRAGEPLAHIEMGVRRFDTEELRSQYQSFVSISDDPPAAPPLILETIR